MYDETFKNQLNKQLTNNKFNMNDIGYADTPYKQSILFRSTPMDIWQLKNGRSYANMAIEYHSKECNPKQVQFFKEHLSEIDKRIEIIENEKFKEWLDARFERTDNIDKKMMREIFDAMDDVDKY